MTDQLDVFAPVSGTIVPLSQVPDPVFSEKMLGDGAAIDPSENSIFAPFNGKVVNLNKNLHAITLSSGTLEVLIHIGLETVQLKGKGFKALVQEGALVKKGQKLIEFDKDFILKNAPSAWVMCVLTSPTDTSVLLQKGTVKMGERLFAVGDRVGAKEEKTSDKVFRSEPITIINPNGLHARPAGVLAQAAKKFPFTITLHKGEKSCDAKSVVGIMGLALNAQDCLIICAHAEQEKQAQEALKILTDLIASGLGEKGGVSLSPSSRVQVAVPNALAKAVPGTSIKGLCACGGLAEGKTFLFKHEEVSFNENAANCADEKMLFEDCSLVLAETLKQEIESATNKSEKTITQVHLEMLQDPFLTQETLRMIEQGKTAAYGFNEAVRKSIDLLRQTGSAFLTERIADFKDLRRRMILLLNGQTDTSYQFPPDSIVLAEDLLPSDVGHFNGNVVGVSLTHGSPTAHVSILLRNKNIPTLVGTGVDFQDIRNQTTAFVDGGEGKLYIAPSADEQKTLHARYLRAHEEEKANRENRFLGAVTQDGTVVEVGGNINSEADAKDSFANGADSLGLVRTEFLFLQEVEAPSEEKQYKEYQAIVTAMEGKPVTLRTLDIGGDKPVRYLTIAPEDNPMIGMRGVRIYDDNLDLFREQVRAMLRVKPTTSLRIMLPMVGFTSEMEHFRQIIEEEKKKVGVKEKVKIGMMVEIPAAALMAEQFAPYADFFSIGTNDLTQYTLAIDRGHKVLNTQADGLSPAVLNLIGQTCKGAQKHNRPVAVCGAMAGDLQAVPLLVGLGVRELAVGAGAISQVKALVRRLRLTDCQAAADKALTLSNATQVREFVRKTFNI